MSAEDSLDEDQESRWKAYLESLEKVAADPSEENKQFSKQCFEQFLSSL